MPHGFGSVAKGAGQVVGHMGGQLGSMIGSGYNSAMDMLSSISKSQIDDIRIRRDKIANPEVTGKYGSKRQFNFGDDTFTRRTTNLAKHYGKDQLKGWGVGTALSAGMYGLSGVMSDNPENDAGDRMANGVKHGAAFTADILADAGISAVSAGLAMMGPYGAMAAGALTVGNMAANFLGLDAGSLVMNAANYADGEYDRVKQGPKFNMTQNTSMAMQRQISNLHASGSNLGEMMHN